MIYNEVGEPVMELSQVEFDKMIERWKSKGHSYYIEKFGGKKYLCRKNKKYYSVLMPNSFDLPIKNNEFGRFLGMFSNQLRSAFKRSPELKKELHKPRGNAYSKNYKLWNEIEVGTLIYEVDLNSAYWQIGHKLGYLSDNVFNKYLENNDYKEAKRLCFSFLARQKTIEKYYANGMYIKEDKTDQSKVNVFNNVIGELSSILEEVQNITKDVIYINTDGVYVLDKDLNKIEDYFKNLGLKYKVDKLIKYTETEVYKLNSKKRKPFCSKQELYNQNLNK